MNKKTWKPYAAIVLILLYGVDIFWLSGFCVYYFGEWGIPMYEGLLAVLALGIVVLFREDVKRAFPFHRPTIAKTVGTLLMWIGTLLITMIPTSILLYVFPEQMSGATESVSELSGGLPFGLAFLLICVTPAIFEEIAFRGGLFSCFRGFRSPWPAILISAAVFGGVGYSPTEFTDFTEASGGLCRQRCLESPWDICLPRRITCFITCSSI